MHPYSLLQQLLSLLVSLSLGVESIVSEAAAPEAAEFVLRLDWPREPGDVGWCISKFLSQTCFASIAGVWPQSLTYIFFLSVVWRAQRSSARWTAAALMKKGLLQDGLARDARGVLADLSALKKEGRKKGRKEERKERKNSWAIVPLSRCTLHTAAIYDHSFWISEWHTKKTMCV